MALEHGLGLVLESPTWRASRDWAERLGHDSETLRELNTRAIALMEDVRATFAPRGLVQVISGCVGPRGDGYQRGMAQIEEARDCGMPVVLSFTLETDARLPSGESLQEAIAAVDTLTQGYPAYYMVNCAHVTHFEAGLPQGAQLLRVRGVRANASRRSHAELDESTTLDDGDPMEFGADYARLRRFLPALRVVGGCCGTDHRHIEQVCRHLAA